jgi:hypothetical protein
MHTIAIFISGRMLGYKENLVPFINSLKNRYNIKLFLSINMFSFADRNIYIPVLTNELQREFGDILAYCNFEEYKMPKSFVENRLQQNYNNFHYNCLSCFYNDKKNLELIEQYEIDNNIKFDIICKTRSEIQFITNLDFIIDNEDELILHNKHMESIRYWGHIHKQTPVMISDAFAYGNKNSMKIYCKTYDWILQNNQSCIYSQTFEIYLTDSILQHIFYNHHGGDGDEPLSYGEIMNKYANNPHKIKINYLDNIHYLIIPEDIRQRNNFTVDKSNVWEYTNVE